MSIFLSRRDLFFRGGSEGRTSEGKQGALAVSQTAADSLGRVIRVEEAFTLRGRAHSRDRDGLEQAGQSEPCLKPGEAVPEVREGLPWESSEQCRGAGRRPRGGPTGSAGLYHGVVRKAVPPDQMGSPCSGLR